MHSEGWAALVKILDHLATQDVESILQGVPDEEYHLLRGKVEALRDVAQLPEKIRTDTGTYYDMMNMGEQ